MSKKYLPRAQCLQAPPKHKGKQQRSLEWGTGVSTPTCVDALAEAQALCGRLSVWIMEGTGQAKSLAPQDTVRVKEMMCGSPWREPPC